MFTKLNLIYNDHLAGTHTCTKLIYCVTSWEIIVFNHINRPVELRCSYVCCLEWLKYFIRTMKTIKGLVRFLHRQYMILTVKAFSRQRYCYHCTRRVFNPYNYKIILICGKFYCAEKYFLWNIFPAANSKRNINYDWPELSPYPCMGHWHINLQKSNCFA